MSPGIKLLTGAALVAAAIGYLAFLGAASSWQYYLSVDEALADAAQLEGLRLRVSGRVVAGSLSIGEDRRHAAFELAGDSHTLQVACHCLLPDNLAEDIEVVVEGVFIGGNVRGEKVITRCASKYEPYEATTTYDNVATAPAT